MSDQVSCGTSCMAGHPGMVLPGEQVHGNCDPSSIADLCPFFHNWLPQALLNQGRCVYSCMTGLH